MVRPHYFGLGISAIGLTTGERDVLNVKEKLQSIQGVPGGMDKTSGEGSLC